MLSIGDVLVRYSQAPTNIVLSEIQNTFARSDDVLESEEAEYEAYVKRHPTFSVESFARDRGNEYLEPST